MKFYERKLNIGYDYTVEDVFGKIVITADYKMPGGHLDAAVSHILQSEATSGTVIDGVTFVWTRAPLWVPEDEVDTPDDAFKAPGTLALSSKSRTTALVLVLIFGGFGIHRFYVGKYGTGLVQMVLTLTVFGMIVSGPWAVIDFIMIAVRTFTDKNGARLK